VRLIGNDAVGVGVISGATVGFVPPGGRFAPESERKSEALGEADDILCVERGEERAPVHLRGSWIVKEGSGDALCDELGKAGECSLPILRKRDDFIGLKLLEPNAKTELVSTAGERHAVFISEDVSVDGEITAVIAASESDLCLGIGRGATTDDDGPDAETREKTRDTDGWRARSGLTRKEVTGAREAETGSVEEGGRKYVRFFSAKDLFAKGKDVGAIGIRDSGSVGVTVINGVDDRERILRREGVVETDRAEIFANRLEWAAGVGRDAAKIGGGGDGSRPKVEIGLDTGNRCRTRFEAGDERDRRLVEVLAEAFVIGEEEGFVLANSPT